jgi:hypothetical protein
VVANVTYCVELPFAMMTMVSRHVVQRAGSAQKTVTSLVQGLTRSDSKHQVSGGASNPDE